MKRQPDHRRRCQLLHRPFKEEYRLNIQSPYIRNGIQSFVFPSSFTANQVIEQIKASPDFSLEFSYKSPAPESNDKDDDEEFEEEKDDCDDEKLEESRQEDKINENDTEAVVTPELNKKPESEESTGASEKGANLGLVIPMKGHNVEVWLENHLPLWLYDLNDEDSLHLIEKHREDHHDYVYLRVIIPRGKQRLTKIVRAPFTKKVKDFVYEINQTKRDLAYFGLFLHDHTFGLWLTDHPNYELGDYELGPMDIVEIKRKPIFEFTFMGSRSNLPLIFEESTPISGVLKSIACCLIPPVEDPSIFGLLLLPQGLSGSLIWLLEERPLNSYDLKIRDVLEFKRKPELIVDDPEPRARLVVKYTPFEDTVRTKSTDGCPRLPGEVVVRIISPVKFFPIFGPSLPVLGTIYLTNFQLIFAADPNSNYEDLFTKMPLFSISRMDLNGPAGTEVYYLDVMCKDLRTLRFSLSRKACSRSTIQRLLEAMIFPKHLEALFAFHYKFSPPETPGNATPTTLTASSSGLSTLGSGSISSGLTGLLGGGSFLGGSFGANTEPVLQYSSSPMKSSAISSSPIRTSPLTMTPASIRNSSPSKNFGATDAWNLYDVETYFHRQRISLQLWRLSSINENYEYSDTYPHKFIVPTTITDDDLKGSMNFRSKGRIPILTYYHYNTATITRSSQPLVGIRGQRSVSDEKLVDAIRAANTNQKPLYVFDARPKTNALANQAMGYGFEFTGASKGYPNCLLEFLGIENIHVMRDSLNRLHNVLIARAGAQGGGSNDYTIDKSDKTWLSSLENSRWFEHLRQLLASSVRICEIVEKEGASVLLHCSDGWDRTAQLVSLAQLFLNPSCRSIEGFEMLIEKDWLAFGHRFHLRCGHAEKQSDERSPIFLQFMDCVWQVLQQFPCSFEFNEKFLLTVMDHLYSCMFGTFLCNCERERKQANLKEKTVSLWAYINSEKEHFVNPFFLPDISILYPSARMEDIQLWKGYYLRWYRRKPNQIITPDMRCLQLSQKYEAMKQRVLELEHKVATISASQANDSDPNTIQSNSNSNSGSNFVA